MEDILEVSALATEVVFDFHNALATVKEAYPDLDPSHFELVAAELAPGGEHFYLAHEPDGPWLAVSPSDDAAFRKMGSPAAEWVERQSWKPLFRLCGERDAQGDWWIDAKEAGA